MGGLGGKRPWREMQVPHLWPTEVGRVASRLVLLSPRRVLVLIALVFGIENSR
jgi:hypothetical protein